MPIPEFILQRMLVPKSFKRNESGFAFSLLNGYAPATITELKLLVDGFEIPLEFITIEIEGQRVMCAAEISNEIPIAFPTGVLIRIHARYASDFHSAAIEAETREAGRIHFTLWKQKGEPDRRRRRRSLFQAPVEFSLPSLVRIQPELTLPIGLNLDTSDMRQVENLGMSHFPLMIHPAVSASSLARWKLCEFIPATLNDPQCPTETRDPYGAMEFTYFCQSNHAYPVNVVDTHRMDPHEAASLAKACSAETGAVPENDESFPFNAPAWIIAGNAWQEWDFSCDSALVYARKLQLYSMAMRNLSPSLKIGALGKWVLTDDTRDENFQWNQQLLHQADDFIDLLFWQLPLLEKWVSAEPRDVYPWQALRDPLTGMIKRLDDQLHGSGRQPPVLQALDCSRFLTSIDCQLKNHITGMDPMDLPFLLFELLNTLLGHTDSFAFVVLGSVSQVFERDSMAHHTLQMILNHLTSASSLKVSRTENENALVLTSRDENQIVVTLLNRLVDRDLRLSFDREDAKALSLVNFQQLHANRNTVRKPSHGKVGIPSMKLPPQSITQLRFATNDDKSPVFKVRT